jgi:accessory colonization factor AcfC
MFARRRRSARIAALAGLVLCALGSPASADQSPPALRVYGHGGPREVLSECAALYGAMYGVAVEVCRVGPGALSRKVAQDGDLFYSGAEFMLEDFDRGNPGVLDMESLEQLHPRRLGIIVRKGNPLAIRRIEDLRRDGIVVLKAGLEGISEFHDETAGADGTPHPVAHRGSDALKAWRADPEIDAWITYRSWHALLAAETEFIEIPDDGALRFTPIVITSRTPRRREAEQFIAFLKSPEARQIFRKHGWD